MGLAGTATIIVGIIVFLIGYWYLGKSSGQKDCKDQPETTSSNYGGGIAGIVIGIILMITGLVLNFRKPAATITAEPVESVSVEEAPSE